MADTTLSPDLRTKLDGIVQQMQTNGESDDYIRGVVNDFKQKYQYGSALPPPGRVSSGTVNTEGPSNIPGNIAIGLGMPATAAALAPLATAGTFGEAGSLAWPLLRSVVGEEAARRTAQHFGAPGWVQGLAGAGGSLLGGVGTSRIGKLLGISSPEEESFALASKYGGGGGRSIADTRRGAQLAAAHRAAFPQGEPLPEGLQPSPRPSLPDVNPIKPDTLPSGTWPGNLAHGESLSKAASVKPGANRTPLWQVNPTPSMPDWNTPGFTPPTPTPGSMGIPPVSPTTVRGTTQATPTATAAPAPGGPIHPMPPASSGPTVGTPGIEMTPIEGMDPGVHRVGSATADVGVASTAKYQAIARGMKAEGVTPEHLSLIERGLASADPKIRESTQSMLNDWATSYHSASIKQANPFNAAMLGYIKEIFGRM